MTGTRESKEEKSRSTGRLSAGSEDTLQIKLNEENFSLAANAQKLSKQMVGVCCKLKQTETQAYDFLLKDLPRHHTVREIQNKEMCTQLTEIQYLLLTGFIKDETLERNFNWLYEIVQRQGTTNEFYCKNTVPISLIQSELETYPAPLDVDCNLLYRNIFQGKVPFDFPKETYRTLKLSTFSLSQIMILEFFKISDFLYSGSFFEFIFLIAQEELRLKSQPKAAPVPDSKLPMEPLEIKKTPQKPKTEFCIITKEGKVAHYHNGRLRFFYPEPSAQAVIQRDLVRELLKREFKKVNLEPHPDNLSKIFPMLVGTFFNLRWTPLMALNLYHNHALFSSLRSSEQIIIRGFIKSSHSNLDEFLKSKLSCPAAQTSFVQSAYAPVRLE